MSADTWASVRPTSGIWPVCSWSATRSAAAPAARRAAISAASLTIRSGPTTSTARRNSVPGICGSSWTRNRAHIWSPTAAVAAPAARPATIAVGSSVSFHGCNVNTPGCSTTRGASSRGITIVASPSRGTTSIVKRSSGIASYPDRYGRSWPTDTSSTSTPWSAIALRTRSSRSE